MSEGGAYDRKAAEQSGQNASELRKYIRRRCYSACSSILILLFRIVLKLTVWEVPFLRPKQFGLWGKKLVLLLLAMMMRLLVGLQLLNKGMLLRVRLCVASLMLWVRRVVNEDSFFECPGGGELSQEVGD